MVFFQVLRVSCVLQELKFLPKVLCYLTGHRWGAVVISHKDGVSSGEGASCCVVFWFLRLYAYKVQILQELKPEDKPRRQFCLWARIVEAVGTINPDMLQRTWAELDYRLDILRVTNGAHVQVY
jgi:hypothetical protein